MNTQVSQVVTGEVTEIFIGDSTPFDKVGTILYISPEELDNFKEAIRRACATWQNQPKSIRALNDLFTFGKVMENMNNV